MSPNDANDRPNLDPLCAPSRKSYFANLVSCEEAKCDSVFPSWVASETYFNTHPTILIHQRANFVCLIEDVHSSSFHFQLIRIVIGIHGSAHDDIISSVAIDVGHSYRVAEIRTELLSGNVSDVGQIPGQQSHLRVITIDGRAI